jgi:hypothetical protein
MRAEFRGLLAAFKLLSCKTRVGESGRKTAAKNESLTPT